jgi:alpha-tubulin suppressor-like RCC1 family protein
MGQYGVLGYGNTNNIGDNEHPATAGDVPVGGATKQLALGYYHTCALLDTGSVRCWGRNSSGQLGLGHTTDIGDNEPASAGGVVALGGEATQISAGIYHTCALMATGQVRCWGAGFSGQLGYANINNVGDNETPASVGPVNVGGGVAEVIAGGFHTCARLTTGAVRCWGANTTGQLGYGHTSTIGDNETPASVAPVNLGGSALELAAGEQHTCALTAGGVKCWGYAGYGQLGYSNTTNVSNPASVGYVNVGATLLHISAGGNQTCGLASDYTIRCWGEGQWGPLGYGNSNSIGDNEHPVAAGPVSVGGSALSISVGFDHTCAVVSDGGYQVRCWGHGGGGKLGYGNTTTVGDTESPSSVPYAIVE